jgi:DNA primase
MDENSNIIFDTIREANNRVKLIEVLAGYDVHPQKGYNDAEWSISMPCPLHKNGHERTPSFGYSFKKDFFNCFGCGKHGRAVEFISDIENRPVLDIAKEILATIPKSSEDSSEFVSEKFEDIFPYLMDVSTYFRDKFSKYKNSPKEMEKIEKVMFFIDSFIVKKGSVNKLKKEHIIVRLDKVKELLK